MMSTRMRGTRLFVLALPLAGLMGWGIWRLEGSGTFGGLSRPERLLEEIRHGVRPEFAKLLFVTEQYRNSNLRVVLDGNVYEIKSALARARAYLQRNYRGETAEAWINTHLYRSPLHGEVINLRFSDGRERPLRDVLLDDLRHLSV